jgi:hypothetical protein
MLQLMLGCCGMQQLVLCVGGCAKGHVLEIHLGNWVHSDLLSRIFFVWGVCLRQASCTG